MKRSYNRHYFASKQSINNIYAFLLLTAGLETVSVPAYSSSSDAAAKVVGKLLVDAKVGKFTLSLLIRHRYVARPRE